MDLIIHCYGYSELIFHVLQGIAMFRESGFYGTIINTMVLMVGVFYALQMSAARAEGQWRQYLLRCMGMIVFVNALLLPKASMLIKDHVEKTIYKVDNIPLAFALPIGAVESFGHVLTMGFEQVFSLVGSQSSTMYYHYGTVFGARLAKEVMEAKIRDPEVTGNMRNFIKRCVILPAMIGHKFTKEELVATTDIWGLVAKNAGDLARTDMVVNNVKHSPTCKEAVAYFEKKFESQAGGLIDQLSAKFRGAGKTAKYNEGLRQLNKNIFGAINALYGSEHKVDSILKNNMMINAINGYRSGKYATARAQMHHEAGGMLSGDLAEKTLTGFLAVMKAFIYAVFIFLFPLLVLSGGIARYKGWIVMVFSLALWPPLSSILNMIIDWGSDPAKVVSYSTWSTEVKKFDSIASIAAGLTLSIPFLAYKVTQLGEGGFMHLAGTIMSTANAATSAIAGEKSVGGRAWDNDSISNSSRDNSNAFKTNHNQEYVSGENGWNRSDGGRANLTAGGKMVITGGSGATSDSGESRFTMESAYRGESDQGVHKSHEKLETDTRSLSDAKSNSFSKTKDFLKNIAEREAAGEKIDYDSMGEQGKSVRQTVSTAKTLAKDYGYTYEQAAEGAIKGEITASTPGKGFFGGVSVSANGSISARNSSNQQFSEKETAERNSALEDNYNNITKAAINQSYSKDSSIDKTQSESVRSAYEEQQRLEQTVAKSRHELDSWQQAQRVISSSGGNSSTDMTGSLIDRYMQEAGISDRPTAYQHVMEHNPAAMRVWNQMQREDTYVQDLVAGIASGKAGVSKEAITKDLDNFTRDNQIVEGANNHKVDDAAKDGGFNLSKIEQNIRQQEGKLQGKYKDMRSGNTDQQVGVGYGIETNEEGLQAKINKFEEDRMGNGLIGKKLPDLTNITGPGKSAYNNASSNQGNDDLSDILPDWKPYTGGKASADKERVEPQLFKKQ